MQILPEERLLWAILERGMLDYLGLTKPTDRHSNNRWRYQAKAWILGNDNHEWSFIWVCDSLGVSAETVRLRLRRLERSGKHFEPAAQGSIIRVLDHDEEPMVATNSHKSSDAEPSELVELDIKRA